jgi:hypothetical protein
MSFDRWTTALSGFIDQVPSELLKPDRSSSGVTRTRKVSTWAYYFPSAAIPFLADLGQSSEYTILDEQSISFSVAAFRSGMTILHFRTDHQSKAGLYLVEAGPVAPRCAALARSEELSIAKSRIMMSGLSSIAFSTANSHDLIEFSKTGFGDLVVTGNEDSRSPLMTAGYGTMAERSCQYSKNLILDYFHRPLVSIFTDKPRPDTPAGNY